MLMTDPKRSSMSTACNAELLKHLRAQRGYTQADLASRVGCSERLIVKAESGRPVSLVTIDSLAKALSHEHATVYPDDLTSDPVTLAKKYMEAFHFQKANLVDAIRYFLDPEIIVRICGDPAVVPFAGEHRGVEAMDRAFKIFFSLLEVPEDHDFSEHFRYIAQGTDVVIWGESYIHPLGQPLERPMTVSNLLRFRRGKLYYLEDNYDTHLASEVLS